MRSFDYQDASHGAIRLHMHSTYLPLASQTQFVESHVKEANLVSQTDRSEELRTFMAIIRSASPLAKHKTDEQLSYNVNEIQALIKSAEDRSEPHVTWKRNQINDECDARFNTVMCSLSPQGHFKDSRVDKKRDAVDTRGATFKKPNAAKQVKPQTKTPAVTGLIPHGKLTLKKTGHVDDLQTELAHRGVALADVPKNITGRKDKLKDLEVTRLMEEGVPHAQALLLGDKHFEKQSNAPFKLTEG